MKNILALGVMGVALVSLLSAGCGKLSDEQKQDAANLVAGTAGQEGKAGSQYALTEDTSNILSQSDFAGQIHHAREVVEGQAWARYFGSSANYETIPDGTCTTLASLSAGGCTFSCPTTSSIKIACALPDGATTTCNSTKYTFASTSFSVVEDLSGITGTGGSAAGTFVASIALQTNVTGGKLDGKTLACSMSFSFDITQAKAGTLSTVAPSCDNFSCSYDGKAIACEDLKAKISAANASCSAS